MAATMFAVLLVGVSAHLRGGITAWRRATTSVEAMQRSRIALERLTQDLANAVIIDPQEEAYVPTVFSEESVQFCTLRPAAQVDSATAEATVELVTYALTDTADGPALTRSRQTLREAHAAWPAEPVTLLPDVEQLSFRYGYHDPGASGDAAIAWESTWADPAFLPRLVEITVQRGEDIAPPRTHRVIVTIPHGKLGSYEEGS